MSEIIRGALAV